MDSPRSHLKLRYQHILFDPDIWYWVAKFLNHRSSCSMASSCTRMSILVWKNMSSLSLGSSSTNTILLQTLNKCKTNRLAHVQLEHSKISKSGMAHLNPFTCLTALEVKDCHHFYSPTAFRGFRNFTNLKTLTLKRSQGTYDDCLKYFPSSLQKLDLEGSQLYQARKLKELPNLKSLNLSRSGIYVLPSASNLTDLNLDRCYLSYAGIHKLKKLKTLRVGHANGNEPNFVDIKKLTKLESISMNFVGDATPQVYSQILCSLPRLTYLSVRAMKTFCLPVLSNLPPGLTYLNLRDSQIDDGLCVRLSRLTNLKNLNLSNTKVSDSGLAYLSPLQKLTHLRLNQTKVQGFGLKHLRSSSALKELTLSKSKLDDENTPYLSHFSKTLTALDVSWCSDLMDDGMKALSSLTRLSLLDVSFCLITDDSLPYLRPCTQLKKLECSGSAMSDAAVTTLMERVN